MRKAISVTAYVTPEEVREYLSGLHGEMLSSNEQTRIDAGMDATVLTNDMAGILCTQAEGMNKSCSAYRQLSECFYQPDIDRSVEEAAQYFADGVGVSLANEQLMINALKQVTDPKTWAELAAESWSYADKLTFIKQMLLGSKWQIKSKQDLLDAVVELQEMA